MMKFWIMMIVRMQRWLTRAEEQLDAKMTNIALDPAGDTLAQAEKINALSDRKRRLVNLAVLYHRLECALSADAWARVETCAAGETLAAAAAREGVSRTTAFRRQRMAFKKAQAVLDKLGFDADRMRDEYGSIGLCKRVYNACIVREREQAAPPVLCRKDLGDTGCSAFSSSDSDYAWQVDSVT